MELLRERGLAKLAKRADREANEGTVGSYLHVQNDHVVMGVLVELVCETDFVAKSPEFNEVATDIAMSSSAKVLVPRTSNSFPALRTWVCPSSLRQKIFPLYAQGEDVKAEAPRSRRRFPYTTSPVRAW